MTIYLLVLRLIHIIAGIIWGGGALIMEFFIGRTILATGETGQKFAQHHPLGALEAAAILRYQSGLPYSTYNATGDSLTSDPNGLRLPSYSTADILIRKPIPFGRMTASIYLDIRNVFNVTRVEAVRRDNGSPNIDEEALQAHAKAAYDAHPEPIPYESPRYRAYADLDANGVIAGEGELLPLYLRAAQDYNTPVFQYGSPRLFRLGFEVMF